MRVMGNSLSHVWRVSILGVLCLLGGRVLVFKLLASVLSLSSYTRVESFDHWEGAEVI